MKEENVTENSDYIKWASKTNKMILFYVSTFLFPVGILLNSIEIVIFQMKKFQKTTMGFFFTINSLLNITIILYLLIFIPVATQNIYLHLKSNFTCKIYYFLLRVLYQASSWLNVLITADRFLFILFSNRFKFQKNKKVLSFIILVIFLSICLFNTPNLMLYRKVIFSKQQNNQTIVTIYCTAEPKILIVRDTFMILLRTIIPFILMFLINLILVYKVKKSQNKFKINRKMRYEFRFVFTVIATTFIFLAIFIPNVIFAIMSNLFQNNRNLEQKQTQGAFLVFFETLSSLGYFANHCLNIFAQLVFNRTFFQQFCLLFRHLRRNLIQKYSKFFNK